MNLFKAQLVLVISLTPIFCMAQDLSGTWKGELFQNPNVTFYFEMRIDNADSNGRVSGTTYIESYGQNYSQKGDFGTIEFTGNFTSNTFNFQETKVVREVKKSSTYYWCIKKGNLNFRIEKNKMVIEGPWSAAGGCVPGTLKVSKEITPLKSAEYCIDGKLNDWKRQGKYETTTDFQNRVNAKNKELKISELKQTCVCDQLDWTTAVYTYNEVEGYYSIACSGFTPFKIYSTKEDAPNFETYFRSLTMDSIVCDIDYENNSFKIPYMALKNGSTNQIYTTVPIPVKIIPVIKTIDTLENRVVETKYTVEVFSKEITLEVWDNNLVDGDIISLNLNGEWLMRNFKVKKGKKKITLTLTQRVNTLIMHAENLGRKPPNTAAIIINDGIKEEKIVLNSDQGKSEAIKIRVY